MISSQINSQTKGNIFDNFPFPLAVNLHITEKCNYQCKFCFAKFAQHKNELALHEWYSILEALALTRCKKVNFAGGEPTLIRFLPDLIIYAKKLGFFTSIVSNGTQISKNFLDYCGTSLDLIGLSIDSQFTSIENSLGRTLKCRKGSAEFSHVSNIVQKVNLIQNYGIALKINTVISEINWKEDMRSFITKLHPYRWKILQFHHIKGITDSFLSKHGNITSFQFQKFFDRHQDIPIQIQAESSDIMEDSYCMVSPDGRFFQNSGNIIQYSKPIIKFGIISAFSELYFSSKKFKDRNGDYFLKTHFLNEFPIEFQ